MNGTAEPFGRSGSCKVVAALRTITSRWRGRPEEPLPMAGLFEEVERETRGWRAVLTRRYRPCLLHSEPGPEFYRDEDGAEYPVTDAVREQWDREVGDVLVIRRTIVGTCKSAGCTPAPEPEPEPVRTDSHSEELPAPKTGPTPTPPRF